jgi:ribonuclease-3 family protein
MENYFRINMEPAQINAISNLGLAHIGDAVFEVLCRGYLCCQGGKRVDNLHRATVAMVKAPAQAADVEKLLPHLTEQELAYYRRGKNSHVHAVPKGATSKMIGQNKENVNYLKEKYSLFNIKVLESEELEGVCIDLTLEERK